MTETEEHKDVPPRPVRLKLVRAFLSLLVGFMAGLVGWTFVLLAILLRQGPSMMTRAPALPPALHIIAFGVPASGAGLWFFRSLGASRG